QAEGSASELWGQILKELEGLKDQVPEDLQEEYQALLDALNDLENQTELTDRLQQLYEGIRQLVEARQQLDAGIQAIIDAYAQMGQDLTEEQARELFSEESLTALQTQLDAAEQELNDGKAQLDAGWAEYEAGAAELAEGRRLLEENAGVLESARA